MEKSVPLKEALLQLPRKGGMLYTTGPHGEAQGFVRRQKGMREEQGPEILSWFPREEMGDSG